MRIDGFTAAPANSAGGADIVNKLKPGDTIRAQVLENSGSELTLKLSDGSRVTAAAMSPVNASEGEFVNFTFKGTVDGKPAFEAASMAAQPQADQALESIKNTLTALKIPVTDENIQLAQALQKQNVPVTAESMSKMQELVNKDSGLKPDAAAFLQASNLSDSENSIKQLQNLLAGRMKVGNDITELIKLMDGENGGTSALNSGSDQVGRLLEKLAAELASKGISLTGPGNDGQAKPASGNAPAPASASPNGAGPANNTNPDGSAAAGKNPGAAAPNANMDLSVNSNTASAANSTGAGKAGTENAMEYPVPGNNANNTDLKNANLNTGNSNVNNTAETNTSVRGPGMGSVGQDPLNGPELRDPGSISARINNLLKGQPPTEADLPLLNAAGRQLEAMISKGGLQPEELASAKLLAGEISSAIFKISGREAPAGISSQNTNLDTDPVRSFKAAVDELKNLFVKIDRKSDDINPVKLYRDMDSALQALKSSVQQLPQSLREAAAAIVNNLDSNVNFINQLNNYSSYVQLPLSIFNQNTTGELYMLKKGSKSRKLDPSNLTVLISLDSNNIGRIDTLMSVNKKNISTNFRLEKSDVFGVLKENHRLLYNNLLEKGFRLVDFTYRLMDEPINIVNFEAEAKKEFIRSPNNIDITI